jgi:salicylate hydroxylase
VITFLSISFETPAATNYAHKSIDYDATADKGTLLKKFSAFHPALLQLIQQAPVIKTWRLHDPHPLSTFTYGKTVLIDDAAHPMLPFAAQGGNQAREDAGALFGLFSNIPTKDVLRDRLRMFDLVRRKRACRLQVTSSVPTEEVHNLREKLKEYAEEDDVPPERKALKERLLRELG